MPKILLIDDEPAIIQAYSMMLERADYSFDTATCVSEALACLDTHDYELILADLILPDGSGLEIIESSKTKDFVPKSIVISGGAQITTKRTAMWIAADLCDIVIAKPSSSKFILKAIEELIGKA